MTSKAAAAAIPGLGAAGEPAAFYVPITTLRGWQGNPRKIPEQQIIELMGSMRRFGFGSPIVARSPDDPELIAGHARLLAAHRLSADVAPVRWMIHLSEAEAHALALADNQLATKSKWDADMLASALRDTKAAGIDLGVLGFSERSLDKLLGEASSGGPIVVEVSELRDEFYMSVRGPVPVQPDALEQLRLALKSIPGLVVEVGLVKR